MLLLKLMGLFLLFTFLSPLVFIIFFFLRYRWYLKWKVWFLYCTRLYIVDNIYKLAHSECEYRAYFNSWGTKSNNPEDEDVGVIASFWTWDYRDFIQDKFRFERIEKHVISKGMDINKPIYFKIKTNIEEVRDSIEAMIKDLLCLHGLNL